MVSSQGKCLSHAKYQFCDQSCSSTTQPHIWLYVQSSALSTTVVGQGHNESHTARRPDYGFSCEDEVKSLKKKASSELSSQSNQRKKAKKVQWATLPTATSAFVSTPCECADIATDLRQTKNICSFLMQRYSARVITPGLRCLGYLQDSGLYKHSFYFRNGTMIHDLNAASQAKIYSIEDAMKQDVHDFIGIVDQLRIAHKLATAVLQYNETPWLPDHWRLLDMKYLGTSGTMDTTALRTLHLSSEITKRPNPAQMDGIELAKHAVTNQMRQGITNSTLFCLGVALTEIAYWSPIEEKATDDDDKNPVLTARRLQKDRAPPLGLEFQSIAKRCLSCDFGFGDQLSEKGLQSAVYTNVVCELEELITKFTKLGIK